MCILEEHQVDMGHDGGSHMRSLPVVPYLFRLSTACSELIVSSGDWYFLWSCGCCWYTAITIPIYQIVSYGGRFSHGRVILVVILNWITLKFSALCIYERPQFDRINCGIWKMKFLQNKFCKQIMDQTEMFGAWKWNFARVLFDNI